MSGARCPSCGGYEWYDGICKHCGYNPPPFKPRVELGEVNVFKLAEGLKKKKEQERRQAIPRLSECPYCHEQSLFYNSIDDQFECMNMKGSCPRYNTPIQSGTTEYEKIAMAQQGETKDKTNEGLS